METESPKFVLGFLSYATPRISGATCPSSSFLLKQVHTPKKQLFHSSHSSKLRLVFFGKGYHRKYKRANISRCCQNNGHSPTFIDWSTLSYQQRCHNTVEVKEVNSVTCFLLCFIVLCESVWIALLLKRKLVASYCAVVVQLIFSLFILYFRTKVPKREDEFEKILRASDMSSRKMELLEPIFSASQTAKQSMSFITNRAREWFRDESTNSRVPENHDSYNERITENLSPSIYATSREEWEESEEEFFGEEEDAPVESVLENPSNEPILIRKEGSTYSKVFSSTKSASQTHMDPKDSSPRVPYNNRKQECRNSKEDIASAVATWESDENISISPPNLLHSFATLFSVVFRHIMTIFQVLIMIARDIWFRSNPRFKTRAWVYPAVVSNKETILAFNRSWSKVSSQFGYFPEDKYSCDDSSDAVEIDSESVSVKESFITLVQDVWKGWRGKSMQFDFWKHISEPFQDSKR
ncbi:hypothetical protein GpartN1_g5108.t1 [Galdieria partita]|uniref:Uncharacterized protein n=1 Tax=Galdieria partita TaxID=83374 RepID=A0A9C7Q187_9RHOD|nr:hypothetical protein GpartN1_g5108.t1 [Galdieria partita]